MPDPFAGHKRPPGCGWTGAPGKDITSLQLNDFLVGPGVVVDLSDATGDYQIYTPQMIEERVEVREGDILIIHTGYHHFGWDQPFADEIRHIV
jgi:kynurenine formamidase